MNCNTTHYRANSSSVPGDPTDYAAAFRAEPALRDKLLLPLLKEGVFPESIFDPAGIEAILGEHFAGKGNHEDALGRLASWGLANRFFRERDTREAPAELFGA